ncbi:hypothetical protein OSB04_000577 [Centaurea solstitialis]|uniref:PHD finger protein MALE STERILITY 1-like ubiquitin-like domain-containing protein n=1 Tax=Centaurea solstitialis TaxID=347529 RepID=A0AA38TZW5_9ASTR|nr:hypothetical protein OSB04_000577 [Centaurea solstitialis]
MMTSSSSRSSSNDDTTRSNHYEFNSFLERVFRLTTFRENVRNYVAEYSKMEDYVVEGMRIWKTILEHGGGLSSGVEKARYKEALKKLSSLKLDMIDVDLIAKYQDLTRKEISTVGQLCSSMLTLVDEQDPAEPNPSTKLSEWALSMEALKKTRKTVCFLVTTERLREVREEVENLYGKAVGRELDFVLRWMRDVIVGGYVVHRADILSTRYDIQYMLKKNPVYRSDIFRDLVELYRRVLSSEDSKTTLDAKVFTKELPCNGNADGFDVFTCQVNPNTEGKKLMVPLDATMADLKRDAEIALRDTYYMMDNVKVMAIVGSEHQDDHLFIRLAPELKKRGISLPVFLGSTCWQQVT